MKTEASIREAPPEAQAVCACGCCGPTAASDPTDPPERAASAAGSCGCGCSGSSGCTCGCECCT